MRAPSQNFDARLYHAALRLYPEAFREEFLHQIACDFNDARADAASSGRTRDLLIFWLHMSRDLMRSIATQWMRTGWPVIATAAVAVTWLQFTAVASFWWQSLFPTGSLGLNEDVVIVFMLAAVVFVVCAVTISTTVWIGRSIRRPRRR